MTLRQILQKLLLAIVVLTVYSCNSSEVTSIQTQPEKSREIKFQEEWIQMRSNSNKLVFKRYYLNPDSNITRCVDCTTWADSTTDSKVITSFNKLFNNIKNEGYCCCPYSQFSVSFFRDTTELAQYFVDTSTTNGKAMFFDGVYQTSYYIDTKDWKIFLTGQTNYH